MKPSTKGIALLCGVLLPLCALADDRLAVAAMNRDIAGVRQFLAEQGADVDALGPHETPALHWLVRLEEHELVQRLLEAGADVNLPTGIGLRALSLAIANADVAMLRLLLEHGAIVDQREPHYQQTALMLAVRSGARAAVDLLLEAGADVNAQSKPEPVPRFRLPAESSASKGVGINWGGWPERGQRAQADGTKTPLLYATRRGDLEITKRLVAAGADLEQRDANDITPLLNAILNAAVANRPERQTQHLEVAHFLIEQGADINARDWYGQTPLWAAVDLRNLDVPGPTRDNGIDRAAVMELIRTLLARGADPNARTQEVLPIRRWITRLGNLSWVDFTGQTPFIRAALSGDVSVMRELVAHGADPNLTTFNGSTALMAAAGINWTVSQTFDEGPEALLEAVQLAHSLGNDVNAQNALGLAAVHGAANRGLDDIIRWLAEQGARLDIQDGVGRSPVDWAHGVFLATHPPVDRPATAALIEDLLAQQRGEQSNITGVSQ